MAYRNIMVNPKIPREKMNSIIIELIKVASSEILKATLNNINLKATNNKIKFKEVEVTVSKHITEVLNWSQKIEFYELSTGMPLEQNTIALTLDTIPRMFRGNRNDTRKISEIDLLKDPQNYLLIGDPGSGKTTLLKRLCRHIILESPQEDECEFNYPVVLRLKELNEDDLISIENNFSTIIAKKIITVSWDVSSIDTEGKNKQPDIGEILPKVLDDTKAIVILDGLDEIVPIHRNAIEESLISFSRKLNYCKIIISCRSGNYDRLMPSFDCIEIYPLSQKQIIKIAKLQLPLNHKIFLEKLFELPYCDLANRPLFLLQLIIIFKNTDEIPDQPFLVYRKIITLILEFWDKHRRIKRHSMYARFDSSRKFDFLSALSYHLTYKVKSKVFSEDVLEKSYRAICDSFNLSEKECFKVVKEIEGHTGLIAKSGNKFEFSHLSLQEYLCANYIVREPFAKHIVDYMEYYPAPVAVAVGIAANASNWFAALILSKRIKGQNIAIGSLISRILLEKPTFEKSLLLGFAIIKLLIDFKEDIFPLLGQLFKNTSIRNSVLDAIELYRIGEYKFDKTMYWMKTKHRIKNDYNLPLPIKVIIEKETFDRFRKLLTA